MAFVFKSQVAQHIGEISYLRVIRAKLTEGMELLNTRTGNKEKLSQLFAVAGKRYAVSRSPNWPPATSAAR